MNELTKRLQINTKIIVKNCNTSLNFLPRYHKEIAMRNKSKSISKIGVTRFSLNTSSVLKKWFIDNIHHPYPSIDEKKLLGKKANLTLK